MSYVVYHKDTTRIARKATGGDTFATEAAAKRHITRFLDAGTYAVAEYSFFRDNIEQKVERINMMSGIKYMESVNTPGFMSPASEAYWSM